jgi:hypothetical protein
MLEGLVSTHCKRSSSLVQGVSSKVKTFYNVAASSSLLLTKPIPSKNDNKNERRRAFVAIIEDTGKSTLYLR